MISLTITACGRPDLLERSLDSIYATGLAAKVDEILVYEDSGEDCNADLIAKYKEVFFFNRSIRVGQIRAIDTLYTLASNPYILHWEEDWICLKANFIEESIEILDKHPEVCMVGLRGIEDTMTQPVLTDKGYLYLDPTYKGHWHGFRFNPGLRRLSDWQDIGGYESKTTFNFDSPADSEIDIAKVYFERGQVAALLRDKYVEHIGRGRHVTF